jgi:hypothetical protein
LVDTKGFQSGVIGLGLIYLQKLLKYSPTFSFTLFLTQSGFLAKKVYRHLVALFWVAFETAEVVISLR